MLLFFYTYQSNRNLQAMSITQYICSKEKVSKNMQKQDFFVNLSLSYVVCFLICKSIIIRISETLHFVT